MKRKNNGLYLRNKTWWMTVKGDRLTTGTTDRKIAERILASVKGRIAEGTYIPLSQKSAEYTFEELVEKYSDFCKRQKSFYSKTGYLKQLALKFSGLLLSDIKTQQVENYQASRLDKGNLPATVNRHIATLKHMYNKASQWEMVSDETLKRIKQVKLFKENNKRMRFLSIEECQKLISTCDNHLRPIIHLALNTGCRKGENLNLTWDKVDLKHGFIAFEKTKNGERRDVPINDDLRHVLQGLTRRLDVPYVFFDSATGKPYGDIKKSFHTALRRAGIKDFHFHDLRHTFASHLVMKGVDITTVSRLLGHKSLTTTLRYSHLAPEHLQKAVDMLKFSIEKTSVTHKISTRAKKRA